MRKALLSTLLVLPLLASMLLPTARADTVRIYAAASLSNAVSDIAKQYEQKHPHVHIIPVFAASSVLAKQIAAGAPADIFFSADESWMRYLVEKKQIKAQQVQRQLSNSLVLISPKNKAFQYTATDNKPTLAQAFTGKLCTGHMASVPAGIYAKQSLQSLHALAALKGRIVGANDVRAALLFVARAECGAGIVYATDAKVSNKVTVIATLPANSHAAIVYPVALTRQSSSRHAAHFLSYLMHSPQAKKIFVQYGFALYARQ